MVLVGASLWACSTESTSPPADGGFVYADGAAPDADGGAVDAIADASKALPYPLTQSCGAPTLPDKCRACREAHCCQSYTTVFATDAGNVLADCIIACSNADAAQEPCYASCFGNTPSETQHVLDHLACLTQNCAVECGGGSNACVNCMGASCPAERAACSLDRDCFLAGTCVADCPNGDLTCTEACVKKYPPASQKLIETQTVCSTKYCKPQCSP